MGVQRDEDFITEFVFVPLYNRSASFRNLIAQQFSSKVVLSDEISFTGSDNKRNPEYGCPDATSKDGKLYIEVKTKLGTPLTDFEKASGARFIKVRGNFIRESKCSAADKKGNRGLNSFSNYGYQHFLDKNKNSNLLLYVVCNDHYKKTELKEACKGKQVAILTWVQILEFLKENNKDDEFIRIIESRVEGVVDDEETSPLEVLDKLCRFSASLAKLGIITAIDGSIANDDYDEIGEGPSMWFGWNSSLTPFENIETLSIVVSTENGNVYLYACSDAYSIVKANKIKFDGKKIEIAYEDEKVKEIYLKLFCMIDDDFEYSDFESDSDFMKDFCDYLKKVESEFKK